MNSVQNRNVEAPIVDAQGRAPTIYDGYTARQIRAFKRLERGAHYRDGKFPDDADMWGPPLASRAVHDDGWVMAATLCEAHIGWWRGESGWPPSIGIRCQANNVDDVAEFTIPMARAFARAILKAARLACVDDGALAPEQPSPHPVLNTETVAP